MQERPARRGRPPLDDTDSTVSIHVRVPSRQYDRVYHEARSARVSIPEFIRRQVGVRGHPADDDNDD